MDMENQNNVNRDGNAGETGTTAAEQARGTEPEKTFTQAEVDHLIQKRLDRERKKSNKEDQPDGKQAELETKERQLKHRELVLQFKEKAAADHMPLSAEKLLDFSSDEAFEESYEILKGFQKEAAEAAIKAEPILHPTAPLGHGGAGVDAIAEAFKRR